MITLSKHQTSVTSVDENYSYVIVNKRLKPIVKSLGC